MKTALHRINLNEIGGVERLFDNFVGASQMGEHHVVLNQPVHPFLDQVKKAQVHNIKWRRGKKLWRPLRRGHARRIFDTIDAGALIYWDIEERNLELLRRRSQDVPLFFYDHGTSWLTHKERRFHEFLRHVDLCIACSRASKRMLELRWEVSAPIHVIKNPLRPDITLGQAKPKTIPTDRPLRIGYVGRLVPAKGHCVALHVLAGLKKRGIDAELFIAGSGNYQSHLEALAAALGIAEQTRFLGCIDDISSFYHQVDLCLNASISEAFGLTSIEAQAFGCVPIVSYTDGLAETIIRGETGIGIIPSLEHDQFPSLGGSMKGFPKFVYDPIEDRLHRPNVMDPGRAVDEIESLLNDPDRYSALSQGGILHAAKSFSFDDYTKKLEELVVSFAVEKKRPSLQLAHELSGKESSLANALYGALLEQPGELPLRHNTVVVKGRLDLSLQKRACRSALGLFEPQAIGPIRLPAWLARRGIRKVLDAIDPNITVHWDCMGEVASGKNLYIDLGAAWDMPQEGFRDFLAQMEGVFTLTHASRRMIESRLGYEGAITKLPFALPHLPAEIFPKKTLSHRPLAIGALAEGGALALHVLKEVQALGLSARLIILGERSDLRQKARDLGLDKSTLFLGSTADIEGFFLGVDLLFASYLKASAPSLAARALSYGCPVVAPAIDALPELAPVYSLELDTADFGLFDEGNVPRHIYDVMADRVTLARTSHPKRVAQAIVDRLANLESDSEKAIAWSKKNLAFDAFHRAFLKSIEQPASLD